MKPLFVAILCVLSGSAGYSSSLADDTATNGEPWIQSVETPQYFAVVVNDVDLSVAWYKQVFGLTQLRDESADDNSWRIVNLSNASVFVEIIEDNRNRTTPGRRIPKNEFYGFAKVGFSVLNVVDVADRVEAATNNRPRVLDFEQFGIQLIQLHDPEGNTIQLSSPMHGSG